MWRQGDVLIEEFEGFNNSNLAKSEDRLLVQGEGRFHGHFIIGEVDIFPNPDFSEQNTVSHYLSVKEESTLRHLHTETKNFTGEHGDLVLKPGRYKVIRQREYNPYAKVIEIIKD